MLNWRFIVAVVLIVGALLLAIGGHRAVNTALSQLQQETADVEADGGSSESIAQLLSCWEQQKNKLSYFVEHEYLETLNDVFIDLKSAQKNEDLQEIETAVNRIALLAKQLLESEEINVSNFF